MLFLWKMYFCKSSYNNNVVVVVNLKIVVSEDFFCKDCCICGRGGGFIVF